MLYLKDVSKTGSKAKVPGAHSHSLLSVNIALKAQAGAIRKKEDNNPNLPTCKGGIQLANLRMT